ncbi:MAG: orotidine-5'-phosphate decarboxylase [Bacteroidia bacterium]
MSVSRKDLIQHIKEKKSFLCVGLDPNIDLIPELLKKEDDVIFAFNKAIIDATAEHCVSFKPNLAFYEAYGVKGMISFEKTVNYIKANYPKHLIIADAKRGDIGNTSSMYAKAFFETFNCDALTIAPYMGSDSIKPFLEFKNKWCVVLALTSNKGAFDFQFLQSDNLPLHETVIKKCLEWGNDENLMFVVGATKAEQLKDIRKIAAKNFLLIPGVGAQGGSLEEVCTNGLNEDIGLLINSSRGIIYASKHDDFADKAKEEALKIHNQMKNYF